MPRLIGALSHAMGLSAFVLVSAGCRDLTDPGSRELGFAPPAATLQLSSTPVSGAGATITALYNFGALGNALSVNSTGHVAGALYGVLSNQQGYTDYLWLTVDAPPTVVLACCGQANDLNDFGDVTGYQGPEQVYLWRQSDGYHLLGTLPGQAKSEAWGINNDGLIVGESGPDRDHAQAVLFLPSTPRSLTDSTITLGSLTGLTYSIAWGVNDAGQIVGEGTDASTGRTYAILWQPAPAGSANYTAVILDPSSVGGAGASARARRISNRGEVVGAVQPAVGESRGFVWSPTAANVTTGDMSDLGPGAGFGVNNHGVAVGTGNDGQPFVWSLQSGRSALPIQGNGAQANDINDAGTIAGWYVLNGYGSFAAIWRLPNQPPVAAAGGPYAGEEGTSIGFSGAGSSDPNTDALSFAWTFGDGATGTGVAPSHPYADNGIYTVTLTVTDSKGASSAPVETTATISNVAPTITSFAFLADPVPVGSAIAVTGAFTDPSSVDTHSATVDWGDGAGPIAATVDAGPRTLSVSRTFSTAGVYTLTLTVTDDDLDATALRATQYVVIYDPRAGFVTGGGWIDSPAGACLWNGCAADGSTIGKATFGFVSRYQNGASAPSGNTAFQFKAGGLNFKSTSYQWLVVAGARAKYKGEGTINGSGSYGFLLTAIDGALPGGGGADQFRIKIWDKGTGGVVYDNKRGDAEDSDAATTLGGGSIVIHK